MKDHLYQKKTNPIRFGMTLQTNKGKCDKQNLRCLIFQSGFQLSLFILLIWHLHDDVGKGENIQTIDDMPFHKIVIIIIRTPIFL